jgi:hypothetical protein
MDLCRILVELMVVVEVASSLEVVELVVELISNNPSSDVLFDHKEVDNLQPYVQIYHN